MFEKWKKEKAEKKEHNIEVDYDNLAIPEVHLKKQAANAEQPSEAEEEIPSVNYDTAIPEIHLSGTHKKKKG